MGKSWQRGLAVGKVRCLSWQHSTRSWTKPGLRRQTPWQETPDHRRKKKLETTLPTLSLSLSPLSRAPTLISQESTFCFNKLSCLCLLSAMLRVSSWIHSHDKVKNLWQLWLGWGLSVWGLPSSPEASILSYDGIMTSGPYRYSLLTFSYGHFCMFSLLAS